MILDALRAALASARDCLAKGVDPNLRRPAQGATPIIEHHLKTACQRLAVLPPA